MRKRAISISEEGFSKLREDQEDPGRANKKDSTGGRR